MASVFISSTNLDLEEYRLAALRAANAAELHADMQEDWTAEDHPPLDKCLEQVGQAGVLVVILAYRYGWVPEDEARNPDGKSITWLECEEAVSNGKHVLAFVVDENADWPEHLKDEADLKRAAATTDAAEAMRLFEATHTSIQRLKDFKQWLGSRGLRRTFRTKEELKLEVERALQDWKLRQVGEAGGPRAREPTPAFIPDAYLHWVRRECESVELLGLEAQELHPTRLSQVYVPAATPAKRSAVDPADGNPLSDREDRPQHDLLLERLGQESLYVPGDPGAGKSTFCRWLALVTASDTMPAHPVADPEKYRETYPEPLRNRLPVLVPLRDLWRSLPLERGARNLGADAFVRALGRWLAKRAGAERIAVETFESLLTAGRALLILDGVDEVSVTDGAEPRRIYPRACLLAALADGQETWTAAGNRMLVTSRPYGLRQEDVQRLGLPEAPLSALEEELQSLFIRRWYAAADPDAAEEKAAGLVDHLAGRPDLAELERNPMLLTALCVRYGEGRRLPQDRHDLYDKIVNNVLFNRYRGEDHERAAVRGRLAAIALGMHTGESIQVKRATPEAAASLDEVERILADYAQLNPATEAGSTAAAQRRDELLARSGLLVGRGPDKAGFYHLSFQEFLAAEHLARTSREPDWFDRVIAERAGVPEWRLTLVFLFGRMLERNGEQWALDATGRLLATQERPAVRANPAPAVLCADWLEILQRRRLNLGDLQEAYAELALAAIEDEIPLQDRFRLAIVLGLIGDPRLGDLRDPKWRKHGLVAVPAGNYAYQEGFQEIHDLFLIGRYPVTNAQFGIFQKDGGYRDSRWWSKEGWKWREQETVTEPAFWRYSQFNAPNQPVVGVSFWEAEAFCRWAGGRLPTEQEWEAAARGPNAHDYPWGGSWENGICNTYEASLNGTSPVGLFPRSRQKELGIEDLAGNVWEWCLNKYDQPEETVIDESGESRAVRGGSWIDLQDFARAVSRLLNLPYYRLYDFGFRVVCFSPIR